MHTILRLNLTTIGLLVSFNIFTAEPCDIAGLDKAAVLKALWKNSLYPSGRSREHASANFVVSGRLNPDILAVLRVDLCGDKFYACLYNADNGYQTAQRTVAKLRADTIRTEARPILEKKLAQRIKLLQATRTKK
ncbi:MAG TPA: hypothetical protein VJJ83_03085 [Candidatus Babeliales bacterium]|nr:hypothetical protein [Candidatus Babeliales bacterium]